MEENQKKNKKIIVAIISVVVLVAIIGIVVFFILNAQKLKLYNSTFELGQENYIEELTKQENVYIKEGYTYSIKDNKVDINNVGIYDVTFEIKGKGKTSEEVKKIQVQDTTPPTVELKKDTFFVGDNINIEEIISIKDLSQAEEIAYSDAKAELDSQFDTSKEGESTVNITVQDKRGNRGTQELKIKVESPVISVFDYITKKIKESNESDNITVYSIDTSNNKFSIKYKTGSASQGWINYTDKIYYEYLKTGSFVFTDTAYFNDSFIVEKVVSTDSWGEKSTYTSGQEIVDRQKYLNSEVEEQKKILNSSDKIILINKTVEQLKNEKIDLREMQ